MFKMATLQGLARDFLSAMDNIEISNIDFFLQPENTDKLKNHYKFETHEGSVIFGFIPDSKLPYKIRKKCLSNFLTFFPEGDVVGGLFYWGQKD